MLRISRVRGWGPPLVFPVWTTGHSLGVAGRTPCPINTGAPHLPSPAGRAIPGAGIRIPLHRWTRRWLRSLCVRRNPDSRACGLGAGLLPPTAETASLAMPGPARRAVPCWSLPGGTPRPNASSGWGRMCAWRLRLNVLPPASPGSPTSDAIGLQPFPTDCAPLTRLARRRATARLRHPVARCVEHTPTASPVFLSSSPVRDRSPAHSVLQRQALRVDLRPVPVGLRPGLQP